MIIYSYIATVLEVAQGARRSRCWTGGGLRGGVTGRHRSELPGQGVDASSLGRQTSGEEQQVFWLSEVKEVASTLRVNVTSLVSGLTVAVAEWLTEQQTPKVKSQDSNSDSNTRSWSVPSKIICDHLYQKHFVRIGVEGLSIATGTGVLFLQCRCTTPA